jgi:hypothetical protein
MNGRDVDVSDGSRVGARWKGTSIEGADSGEDVSGIDGWRTGVAGSLVFPINEGTATGAEIVFRSVNTVGSS